MIQIKFNHKKNLSHKYKINHNSLKIYKLKKNYHKINLVFYNNLK